MALPVAPTYARSFLSHLKENEVGPQVQSYLLRVGCLTVQQMYGRCDDVTEIQANIIAGAIPNPGDSSATLELQLLEKSKLKHVWLQCEALVKHELEKLATGRTDDELDDAPLSRDDYLMVTGAFKAKFDWSLPASRMIGDGLLGKIRRQFQKNAVSLVVVNRTTCLADANRGQEPKRQKFGPGPSHGSHLEWVTGEVDAVPCPDTRAFLRLLRLLTTGWAVAGCYKVTWDNREMICAHWQECDTWLRTFEEIAWKWVDDFGDAAAHDKITVVEERFRVGAIELTRDHVEDEPPMPWGRASLRDKWYIFTEARQELAEHFGSKSPGTRAPAPSGARASSRSFNKARPSQATTANKVRFTKVKKERVTVRNASEPACGKYTKDGSVVCKAVNDKRGCTGLAGKCPKGQYHGCDILLLSTKACCGSQTHTRTHAHPAQGRPTRKMGSVQRSQKVTNRSPARVCWFWCGGRSL